MPRRRGRLRPLAVAAARERAGRAGPHDGRGRRRRLLPRNLFPGGPVTVPPFNKAAAVARLLALLGLVLVSYGAHLVYAPAGFIVAGAICLTVGIGAMRA